MGALLSSSDAMLSHDDILEIQKTSPFSATEIQRLYQRFRHLDRDHSGAISFDEFMRIPEFAMNPLARRILGAFRQTQDDHSEDVNFKQFVEALSAFSRNASRDQKLAFAFRVYDEKCDGVLDDEELYQVLKALAGPNLVEHDLQQLVQQTFRESGAIDRRLTFDQFRRVLHDYDADSAMTINL
jgi:serine/threonine-protein phosphatase 2B regulatory subunit